MKKRHTKKQIQEAYNSFEGAGPVTALQLVEAVFNDKDYSPKLALQARVWAEVEITDGTRRYGSDNPGTGVKKGQFVPQRFPVVDVKAEGRSTIVLECDVPGRHREALTFMELKTRFLDAKVKPDDVVAVRCCGHDAGDVIAVSVYTGEMPGIGQFYGAGQHVIAVQCAAGPEFKKLRGEGRFGTAGTAGAAEGSESSYLGEWNAAEHGQPGEFTVVFGPYDEQAFRDVLSQYPQTAIDALVGGKPYRYKQLAGSDYKGVRVFGNASAAKQAFKDVCRNYKLFAFPETTDIRWTQLRPGRECFFQWAAGNTPSEMWTMMSGAGDGNQFLGLFYGRCRQEYRRAAAENGNINIHPIWDAAVPPKAAAGR